MTVIKPLHIAMLSIHSSPLGPLGSINTGGMSVYVSELSRWLGRSGQFIDIYTYTPGTPQSIELHPNVRLIHLLDKNRPQVAKSMLPSRLDRVFAALEHYRRQSRATYQLIHSHYWLSGVVGAKAQQQWRIPHLITFHTLGAIKNTTTTAENEPQGRIDQERQLVQAANGVIVPVNREKEYLLECFDAPAEKVEIIPCGVNLERFQPVSRSAARQRLGMGHQAEIALFVGRFAPLKGLDVLLEAIALLKTRRPRLELVAVGGDGPDAEGDRALRDRARRLGIETRVRFAGRIAPQRLADYYSAADFLALPSHYESFGLVVLEAMACGTPVLATPVGIADRVIAEGVNGTLANRPNAQSLARGMLRLLTPPPHLRPAPSQVRASVSRYGWERSAQVMIKHYERTLADFAN